MDPHKKGRLLGVKDIILRDPSKNCRLFGVIRLSL